MSNLIHLVHKTPQQDTGTQLLAPELHDSGMLCHYESLMSQKIDVYSFGVLLGKISFSNLNGSPQGGVKTQIHQLVENCTKLAPQERPVVNNILAQIDQISSVSILL